MSLKFLSGMALIAISAYCGYTLLEKHYWQPKSDQIAPDLALPLFTAKQIKTTNFSENGIRNHLLSAELVEYIRQKDETYFEHPKLITFENGTKEAWQIFADEAVLKDKSLLIMQGNVKIFNLLPNAQIKIVKTDALSLNLINQDFWSTHPTTIEGVQIYSSGEQLKGNFSDHQIELLGNTQSHYENKQI